MRDWQDRLEISMVHPGLWPAAATDAALWERSVHALLEDPFFERIEVGPITSSRQRRQLAEWLRIAGMKGVYLLQPLIFGERLNLQSSDESERIHAVARLIEAMDDAVEAGADRTAIISGPYDSAVNPDDAIRRLGESLQELDHAADERGLQLDLELFDTTVDKKRFVGDSSLAARLMEQLASSTSRLGLLVDLSHVPLLNETIEDTIARTKPWIGHVHIGNCSIDAGDERYGDKHPYFGYPGGCHDELHVARFLRALIDAGYMSEHQKTSLGIEIMTAAGEDPLLLIAGAKRTLAKALQGVSNPSRK